MTRSIPGGGNQTAYKKKGKTPIGRARFRSQGLWWENPSINRTPDSRKKNHTREKKKGVMRKYTIITREKKKPKTEEGSRTDWEEKKKWY